MTIVYSYDFSEAATDAAPGAAAVAASLQQSLLIAHVVDPANRFLGRELEAKLDAATAARLEMLAVQLRGTYPSIKIATVQLEGDPVETLNTLARKEEARLLIVGSSGHSEVRQRVGSVSERVARGATVPVLVMREATPWQDWAAGRRRLRAVLGVSRDASCEAAIEMIGVLRQAAPCDVVATEVFFVPDMARHYGLAVSSNWGPDSELERLMERDLARRLAGLRGTGEIRSSPLRAIGGTASHLIDVAERDKAEVIVVGKHWPASPRRLASFSEEVLHLSRTSVLIVPGPAVTTGRGQVPRFQVVLAASDLTSFGNQAVRHALSLAEAAGAELHLVHVTEDHVLTWDQEASIVASLRKLIPEACSVPVATEVVPGNEPSQAIAAAAERIDADAICAASHARGGLARLALGSVTEELLRRTHRPVLVVRPTEA